MSDGPTFSVWVWAAPIIVMQVVAQVFQLGDGGAKKRAPGAGPVDFDAAFRNFIPAKWLDGPDPYCSFPFDGRSIIYNGNGRGFTRNTIATVKTHSSVILRPDTGSYVAPYQYTGVTERFDKATGLAADGQTLLRDPVFNDCYKLDKSGQAPTSEFSISVSSYSTGTVTAHFVGDAKNPLTPQFLTPGITWDAWIVVSKATPGSQATFTTTGVHDCFPAFEVYIGEQRIHEWTPVSHTPSNVASCLAGFNQRTFNNSGQVN